MGQITSAIPGLALGYVRKERKAPGTRVVIAPTTSAGVRRLPWPPA